MIKSSSCLKKSAVFPAVMLFVFLHYNFLPTDSNRLLIPTYLTSANERTQTASVLRRGFEPLFIPPHNSVYGCRVHRLAVCALPFRHLSILQLFKYPLSCQQCRPTIRRLSEQFLWYASLSSFPCTSG